jgi:hypothetical protein
MFSPAREESAPVPLRPALVNPLSLGLGCCGKGDLYRNE